MSSEDNKERRVKRGSKDSQSDPKRERRYTRREILRTAAAACLTMAASAVLLDRKPVGSQEEKAKGLARVPDHRIEQGQTRTQQLGTYVPRGGVEQAHRR